MWSIRGRAERDRLSRFWNALAGGAPPDELDRLATGLDPDLIADIELTRRGHDVRAPDPAFVRRLEDDLMHVLAMPRPASLPLRLPRSHPSNGRVDERTWIGRPLGPSLPTRARRWAGAQLATAIMLILVLLGSFFVFYGNRPAVLPPLQASPTAAPATPEATPDAHAWPMLGGNPARTNNMFGSGPTDEPTQLWSYPPAGVANPHIEVDRGAVADGVLYLPSTTGSIIAIDAATGQELWRADGYSASVVVDGDGLIVHYIGNSVDTLARISRADGSYVWTAEPGQNDWDWTPAVVDGVGYVPSGGDFIAFDPATGAVRWRLHLAARASRGAAVAGGLAVLGDERGTIYGVATASGEILWTYQTDAKTVGQPSLANGIAYVNGRDGAEEAFYALDAATGALEWRFVAPSGSPLLSAAVDASNVYLPADDGNLYALDAATGALKWTFRTGVASAGRPALVGGTLYLVADSGTAFALDPATGAERWRFQLGTTGRSPAVDPAGGSGVLVVDGALYASPLAATLYAIGD